MTSPNGEKFSGVRGWAVIVSSGPCKGIPIVDMVAGVCWTENPPRNKCNCGCWRSPGLSGHAVRKGKIVFDRNGRLEEIVSAC